MWQTSDVLIKVFSSFMFFRRYFSKDFDHSHRTTTSKKNPLCLLLFFMAVITSCYYEKIRTTMCTAMVSLYLLKVTDREKAPSNKTPALTKSTNLGISAFDTLNHQRSKVVTSKTPSFVIGSFCSHHSICLNIGFSHVTFVWKWCVFNLGAFN